MQRATSLPLQPATVIARAIKLANAPDDSLQQICAQLRVLPPKAPYALDNRLNVRPLSRLAPRDALRRLKAARAQMQVVLLGGYPGASVRSLGKSQRLGLKKHGPSRERLRINFGSDAFWWRVETSGGLDDGYVVPTLDALLGVTCTLVQSGSVRVQQCVWCRKFYIPTGKVIKCSPACDVSYEKFKSHCRTNKVRGLPPPER